MWYTYLASKWYSRISMKIIDYLGVDCIQAKKKWKKKQSKTKAVEKKSIPTYYLSFNSGEKNQQKQTNNYFLPQFCPLDTIQVKTRVIDDQIFQILFQTTTSHYILNTHKTTKSRLRLNYILLIKNEWTNSFSIMIFKPPPLQIHDKN